MSDLTISLLGLGGGIALATVVWVGSLIVRVSGVAMTDEVMAKEDARREGYDEYVRRTNAFLPGPGKPA